MNILPYDKPKQLESLLIVDDNEDTAGYIQALVAEEGFKTAVASSGKNALQKMCNGGFDLAILDILMPDMSGIDVAHQMKTIAGKDFFPIILVTALNSDDKKVEGLMYADDYLTKPFSAEELLARIKSLLRIRRFRRLMRRLSGSGRPRGKGR